MNVQYVSIPQGNFKTAPDQSEGSCNGCCAHIKSPTYKPGLCGALASEAPCYKERFVFALDPDWAEHQIVHDGSPPAALYRPVHGGYPAAQKNCGNPACCTDGGCDRPLARATDPATSHEAAAKVGGGKLADLILTMLQFGTGSGKENAGYNGKEIAAYLSKPLNSITPRFASLTRMGLIHANGKRDGQNVWFLGNGVAA